MSGTRTTLTAYSFIIVLLYLITYYFSSFFFTDTATTEIYTLSLRDAIPILKVDHIDIQPAHAVLAFTTDRIRFQITVKDRKSTRLNSSHRCISYAVFCLKKKKKQ